MLPKQPPDEHVNSEDHAALECDVPQRAALEQRMAARSQRALWIAMIVGVVFGGAAFAYKIVEFLFTLSAPEARGFAEVPIAVYFCVAGGWMCLLAWCFASGQFKNLEQAKFEMLEMEEEYERRGI